MRPARAISLMLATVIATAPMVSCKDNSRSAPPPAVDDTRGGVAARELPAPDRPRLSTGKKVVILAGAAALYYLYKHHKNAAQKEGAEGQYYLSKNGRVYYRDAEHRAHWVTPPPEGIAVPESEAAEYRGFQGYDNRTTGRDLSDLAPDSDT
jgi:hypothetical protein